MYSRGSGRRFWCGLLDVYVKGSFDVNVDVDVFWDEKRL